MTDQNSVLTSLIDPCRADLRDLETDEAGAASLGAPGFGEPWHAQVFAIALALSKAGHFSWETWVNTFSEEIRRHPQQAYETSDEAYYRQWAEALSGLLQKTGMMNETEMAEAVEAWRRSFLHTRHGQPIEFRRDLPLPSYDHVDHHHHGAPETAPEPVTVSPACSG